eukprot:snap_masked-scaffold_4-processed-gene-13.20-mRNA-1 protein AED:1.00 eAED:1.00 QI:0/-1/0/0/-1/1/1/0/278
MISNVKLQTISSSKGLTQINCHLSNKNIFIFDFDRTLTNGLNLSENSSINQRIRGGKTTVELLKKLKKTSSLYVLTARSELQALLSAFEHSQVELKDIFVQEGNLEDVIFKETKIQISNKILSTGYNKELGIEYILEKELRNENQQNIQIFFVDDYVANAYSVFMHFQYLKETGKEFEASNIKINLCSIFWDTYEEEMTGSMKLSNPYFGEFNFSENNSICCREFGISEEEREKRSKEYFSKFPPPIEVQKRQPKKLDTTGNLKLNATLENIFASRKS